MTATWSALLRFASTLAQFQTSRDSKAQGRKARGLAFAPYDFMYFSPSLRVVLLLNGLLITLHLACSAGPETGEVHGKVTFKGKPVTEGLVTFLNPTEGGGAEAPIGADGAYAVQGGVVVGDYLAVVTPLVEIVDTDPGKTPPGPVEKNAPNIPRKYRMQGSTPLRAKVKSGKNEINLELKP